MNIKGKIIAAVCVVLLFIPSVIAAVSYASARNSPVESNAVKRMVMNDIDGETFTFDRTVESDTAASQGNDGDIGDVIQFFIEMNKSAQTASSLPEPLVGTEHYEVTYYSYDMETVYEYYFSADPNDAYYVDHKGKAFKIKPEYAERFVNSEYAVSLYKEAAAPVLMIGSTTIIPQEMSWKYLLSNNEYSDAVVKTTAEMLAYTISGQLNLNFNVQPDYISVQILENDSLIFDDSYEKIGTVDFNENTRLLIAVTAEWMENAERGGYGRAVYRFNADVRAPSEFYLGNTGIVPGDFVVISGKNVVDVNSIQFTSEPDIGYTPVFFQEGNYVMALVPIRYDIEQSPSYTFTIVCEDVTSELTLHVNEKEFKSQGYDVSAEVVASTRTNATLAAFDEEMTPVFANQESTRYWTDEAFYNYEADMRIKTGFGLFRTITISGTKYRHEGVDFMAAAGYQIPAAQSGKVIYSSSTTLSGRTVVIDHGYGLKSLYAHMSSTSVSVGDVVNKGDIVGVVGSTGFTNGLNFHYGLYVFDVPVSPYTTWSDAIPIEKP